MWLAVLIVVAVFSIGFILGQALERR